MKDEERGQTPTPPPGAMPSQTAESELEGAGNGATPARHSADEHETEVPPPSLPPGLTPDFFEPPSSARIRTSGTVESEPSQAAGLAPLSLTLIEPPKLLYEREREPSEDSPI